MQNIFFFQTQQILDDTILFNEFKKQKIFYSYFQVDRNYYLFLYRQKFIHLDLIYQSVEIIQELDSKQRKIRSLRGFFLYALEIIEKGKEYEILETNLQPFFWRKVKNIIRQNKKGALLEFLFGGEVTRMESANGRGDSFKSSRTDLDAKIQTLQNQVDSLHQKIIELESKLENPKYALSEPSQPLESSKTIQHDNSTMNGKKGPYLTQNENEIRNPAYQTKDLESKSFSEDSKIDFKTLSHSQQYNISSNEEKGRNRQNFVTLGKISDEEKIEIIKLGFQLQNEGKISLKKYYESTDPYSLSQFNGYSIKYESIRRTKFYQQLKLSNN
jgi:hypothetical protein